MMRWGRLLLYAVCYGIGYVWGRLANGWAWAMDACGDGRYDAQHR